MTKILDKFSGMFSGKKDRKLDNSKNTKIRKTLGKISGAFMLPISIMAISGLWLGIGAAIAANSGQNTGLLTFGNFIQQLGDPVFGSLPLLFAAAFVIAFTDEAGVGVFAAIIGYAVFAAIQSVFITETTKEVFEKLLTSDGKEEIINSATNKPIEIKKIVHVGYKVLFTGAGRNPEALDRVVGTTLGIRSLQTSVFGGLAVGLVVQYIYNKFHTIQLPGVFSFFGGKRFVSIVTVPAAAALAIVFLILWPWIGVALSGFGNALGKVPYGFESLIFGFVERSLVPFGLHHAFYAPLWYSPAGGDINFSLEEWQKFLSSDAPEQAAKLKEAISLAKSGDAALANNEYANLAKLIVTVAKEPSKFQGDSSGATALLKFDFDSVVYPHVIKSGEVVQSVSNKELPLFKFVEQQLGIKIGRFADGKFSFMIFGLPAAAAAMIFAAPKENRKVAISAVVPSAITTILTGVAEPIEFTFLFLSPLLFWGFHAFFCAISFMLANLFSVHIPQIFSGGLLDLIIYGVVPVAKGTNFWWTLLVGLAYVPIYFFGFYFWIKFRDLKTPGRGETVKLFTKKDYLQSKDDKSLNSSLDMRAYEIVQGFGGTQNITAYNNCASRLRYDVKDMSLVDEDRLKATGAVAIKKEGAHHVQAIYGAVAEQLNAKIKSSRATIVEHEMKIDANSLAIENNSTMIDMDKKKLNKENLLINPLKVGPVVYGELIALKDVNDGVFSEKLMGDGFAMKFNAQETGKVYAPVDGYMSVVFETKHAYGITTKEGVEILIHIGIDTVNLKGEGFKSFVKVGDQVKRGDLLAEVNLKLLKDKKLKTFPIVVVLNESKHKNITFKTEAKNITDKSIDIIEVR